MDLDGDGVKDVLTGSAQGQFYFFRGEGQGRFAERKALCDAEDRPINLGSYANIAPVDWNSDGHLDLVCYISGSKKAEGPLYLLEGLGDLKYRVAGPIEIGGRKLSYGGGGFPQLHDARVHFFDWNGDGVPDLFLGNGNGEVTLHLGTRNASGTLCLGEPRTLIPRFPGSAGPGAVALLDPQKQSLLNPRSGRRPTISVTDWNGDGLPDLLVGDLLNIQEARELTPDQSSRKMAIQKQLKQVVAESQNRIAAVCRAALQAIGKQNVDCLSEAEMQRYTQRVEEELANDEAYQSCENEKRALNDELASFDIKRLSAGYVWVYLQKPPVLAIAPGSNKKKPREGYSQGR